MTAASVTFLVIGPAVSCSAEIGTTPVRLIRPRVGLMPTMPFWPDGQTIDPSVSVPIATGARLAAIPAPEPELEPHGLRSSTYGLLVWPPTPLHPLDDRNERKFAHSDRLALARITAPASRSRPTRNASRPRAPSSASEPAVARRLAVPTLSLSRTGMPSIGPRRRWVARRMSLNAASISAVGLVAITAWSSGF